MLQFILYPRQDDYPVERSDVTADYDSELDDYLKISARSLIGRKALSAGFQSSAGTPNGAWAESSTQ